MSVSLLVLPRAAWVWVALVFGSVPLTTTPDRTSPRLVHTRLLRSQPAADTVLAEAPTEIRLWFSEAVTVSLTRVVLRGPSKDVPVGAAQHVGGAAAPVVVPIRQPLLPGRYVVRWTTASGDGHPVKGEFRFSLAAAARGP